MRILTPLIRQRGLAIVETAITLPFLLFVMLAATELTNAFIQHMSLTKAVRDGARWAAEEAIVSNTFRWTGALEKESRNLVVYGNRAGSGTPLIPGLSIDDVIARPVGGNNIEVSVNYPYSGIFGSVLPSFGYGSNISTLFNMNATVTMKAL